MQPDTKRNTSSAWSVWKHYRKEEINKKCSNDSDGEMIQIMKNGDLLDNEWMPVDWVAKYFGGGCVVYHKFKFV